jgi:hypothetical protein
MGVSIDVWRIRIGCFSPKCRQSKCILKNKLIVTIRKGFFLHCFVVICILLIIGGVESNPGPTLQEIQELVTASENSLMSKIADLVNNSKQETINAINDVKTDVSNLTKQVSHLEKDLCDAKDKISALEKENKELCDKIDTLDNTNRKCNLIVFGLAESTDCNDPVAEFCNFISSSLGIAMTGAQVVRAYRMGQNNNKRPLFVSLINQKVKIDIMKNVGKLKGSKISISDDLTPKAREIRKLLVSRASYARSHGHDVKIRSKSLIINNVEYTYEVLRSNAWKIDIAGGSRLRSNSQSSTMSKKRSRSDNNTDGDLSESDYTETEEPVIAGTSKQGNLMPPPTQPVGGGSSQPKVPKRKKMNNKK